MRAGSDLVHTEILVPGSIANLGPGLDTLAVAVQLYLRLRVTSVDPSRSGVEFRFIGRRPEGDNNIERAFRYLSNGCDGPFVSVDVETEIPMKAGLGSSAAATVAGLRLFEAVHGQRSKDELLAAASKLEGHPDNAAAALLGGLAVCCHRSDGSVGAASCRWPDDWSFVVLTPELALETSKSRQALPASVPLSDAVANLQRVATLLAAVHSGDAAALAGLFEDRLHQPFREPLVPGLREITQLRHPQILGAFLSGSGPSIAVLTQGESKAAEQLLTAAYQPLGIAFQLRRLRVHASEGVPAAQTRILFV